MFRKKFVIIMALLGVLFINAFFITQMKFLNDGNFVQKYILVSNSSLIQNGLAKLGLNHKTDGHEPTPASAEIERDSTIKPHSIVDEKHETPTKKVSETHVQLPLSYEIKPKVPGICNISSTHADPSTPKPTENILVFFQLPAENFTERAELRSELSAIENVKILFVTGESQNKTVEKNIKMESKRFRDLLIVEDIESDKKNSILMRLASFEWTVKNCKDISFIIVVNYSNKGDLVDLKKVLVERAYSNMNFQCLLSDITELPKTQDTSATKPGAEKPRLADPMESMREEALQDLTKSFIICEESTFLVSSNTALESYYNFLLKSF